MKTPSNASRGSWLHPAGCNPRITSYSAYKANSCGASWVTVAESDQSVEFESNARCFLNEFDEVKTLSNASRDSWLHPAGCNPRITSYSAYKANSCGASWVTVAESDQSVERESNARCFLTESDESKTPSNASRGSWLHPAGCNPRIASYSTWQDVE